MTILYNKALAAENVARYQKCQRTRNVACLAMAGLSILGAVMSLTLIYFAVPEWLSQMSLALGFIAMLLTFVLMSDKMSTFLKITSMPTPDVIYYHVAGNKTILEIRIETRDYIWHKNVPLALLVTQDHNGLVEEVELCVVKYQESTEHTEEAFDANKGIIYVPYGERANI